MLIEFPPVRSIFAEVLEMDGLPAYEIEGRVWTDALHRHRPDAPARVEISAWGDVDALIDDARRCPFPGCEGRETVRRIDAERQAELSDLCAFVGSAR